MTVKRGFSHSTASLKVLMLEFSWFLTDESAAQFSFCCCDLSSIILCLAIVVRAESLSHLDRCCDGSTALAATRAGFLESFRAPALLLSRFSFDSLWRNCLFFPLFYYYKLKNKTALFREKGKRVPFDRRKFFSSKLLDTLTRDSSCHHFE